MTVYDTVYDPFMTPCISQGFHENNRFFMFFRVFQCLLIGVEKWVSQWGYPREKVALNLMELESKSVKNTTFLTPFFMIFDEF